MDPVNTTEQIAQEAAQLGQVITPELQEGFLQYLSRFMNEGGVFMWIIFGVFLFGIGLVIERYIAYRKYDTDTRSLLSALKNFIANGDLHGALNLCQTGKGLVNHVLKNALKRGHQDREHIELAITSGIIEVAPLVERRLNYVELCANTSTLFGLLGTIQGLIGSFSAVSGADASEKAKLLALGISTAMNTTALGLVSAISLMVAYSIISSKSNKILTDLEEGGNKVLDLILLRKSTLAPITDHLPSGNSVSGNGTPPSFNSTKQAS